MKARVKSTGHIVNVELSHYMGDVAWYITKCNASYSENELEFIDKPQDYWTRLEHQYAGMAMQGILASCEHYRILSSEQVTLDAYKYAHALIQKLKEKEEK